MAYYLIEMEFKFLTYCLQMIVILSSNSGGMPTIKNHPGAI